MSENDSSPATPAGLDPELIPLPDVAELTGLDIARVHQLIRDGEWVAIPNEAGRRSIPRSLVVSGGAVKGLPGVITLLRDARFTDAEIVDWLFRPDDSLPGTPAAALAENRGTEVKRRAQAAGF